VKRSAAQAFSFRSRAAEHVQARMNSLARYILALDYSQEAGNWLCARQDGKERRKR